MTSVQSLDVMGKLKDINGYVRTTIDKLPGITDDLVRIDSDCHNWNFGKFVEQLRQWAERNPISFEKKPPEYQQRKRACHVRQSGSELNNHKSTNCNSVTSVNEDEKF